MNIYTRNGDFGFTTDLTGKKVSKASAKLNLQGSIDEANAGIGYLRALLEEILMEKKNVSEDVYKPEAMDALKPLMGYLKQVQYKLFQLGSDISSDFSQCRFTTEDVEDLEKAIDHMLAATGELRHFICLGGNKAAAYCHVVRSTIRRSERDFVHYLDALDVDVPVDYKYVNRLSDYMFQCARYINYLLNVPEETF